MPDWPWHTAELDDMLAEAEVLKREGNALLAAGHLDLAKHKYEKTFHNLDGLRGLNHEDDYDRVQALKTVRPSEPIGCV